MYAVLQPHPVATWPQLLHLHKPHPGSIVKMYVIDEILRLLTEENLI